MLQSILWIGDMGVYSVRGTREGELASCGGDSREQALPECLLAMNALVAVSWIALRMAAVMPVLVELHAQVSSIDRDLHHVQLAPA